VCYRAAIIARPSIVGLLVGVALALGLAYAVSSSQASPHRVVIERAAVLAHGDHALGALPRRTALRGTVVLRPRDEGALTRFIATVTDRGSARFGDYLAPGAFGARFGPTAATRAALVSALRAAGLQVGHISSDGLLVPFSGSTGIVERAFATSVQAVRLPSGRMAHATTTPISLPSQVAGSVEAVLGLDNTTQPHLIGAGQRHRGDPAGGQAPHAAASSADGPVACPDATAAAQHDNGLTDTEIADAYGAGPLYASGDDGAGQRIAVYELEPFLRSDIERFDACYFGATRAHAMMSRLTVHAVNGGQPHGHGEGEASLDVDDLSALAPGADIDVYVAPQSDALGEYAQIIDADRDRIVTTSWGECEQAAQHGQRGLQQAENLLFEQAAAQGQTVFAAAGDSGSDDCAGGTSPAEHENPIAVDDPASQPYVVGVGGTAIDDTGTGNPLEHVWNDGTAYGAGGGGISMSWAMTSWQRAARLPGIAVPGSADYAHAGKVEEETGYPAGFCDSYLRSASRGEPCRLVPDVSAQADEFTGGITVYSRAYATKHNPTGWTTAGGTSSAAPIWAATLALVNASATCSADARTRRGVGFAAPLLYAVASDPASYAASFTDVRAGNNDVYGLDNGEIYPATRGYDPTSGLGSPRLTDGTNGAGLATDLCAAAAAGDAPSIRSLSPTEGPASGGGRLLIHGNGFAAGGRSRVASVQVGLWRVPASALTVRGAHTIALTLPAERKAVPPAGEAAESGFGPATVIVTLRDGQSSAPGPRSIVHYVSRAAHATLPTVGVVAPYGGPDHAGAQVTLLGSGYDHVSSVSFGGVRATHLRVHGSGEITVTVPARSARTRCTPLPRRGVYAGENASNDVCQVQVRVRAGGHVSAPATIRAPIEGLQRKDALGDLLAFRGCHCETAPASDEYDYLPRPHISEVSTHEGPSSLANEHGGTLISVRGTGLNPLDLDWADFGDPHAYASQRTTYLYASATRLIIRAPAHKLTASRQPVAFSVRSLAGQSNERTVLYAGLPEVTSVVNVRDPINLNGLYGGPDTGGTPIVVHGHGMSGQVLGLELTGPGRSFALGSQYRVQPLSNRELRTETVAVNPTVATVQPCTVTGCTKPSSTDRFWLYAQGTPSVSAISPDSGAAAGGTAVTVTGQNLGCPISVSFGTAAATTITPVKTLLQCGSTQSLTASAPAGTAGQSVPVRVQTAESFYTRSRPLSVAQFTYH
jgi:hypothetical protein